MACDYTYITQEAAGVCLCTPRVAPRSSWRPHSHRIVPLFSPAQ